MGIGNSSVFREIALIKNERLLVDNHVIYGKITDIYTTGEIVYLVDSHTVFHTAIMNQHGLLFFDALGESCFVPAKIFFQPPHRIVLIPKADISTNSRKNGRIVTPNLPAKIYDKEMHHEEKAFITDICSCGAGILHAKKLQNGLIYKLQALFPFHNRTLRFISSFLVKTQQI